MVRERHNTCVYVHGLGRHALCIWLERDGKRGQKGRC